MIKNNMNQKNKSFQNRDEAGSAIVIALLIMALLMGFVALAVSRTTSETAAAYNDVSESRAFEAAQASLEVMTHNFDKIFDEKLSPTQADLNAINAGSVPGFDADFTFDQNIRITQATQTVVVSGQLLQGLNALRDEWQCQTVATDKKTGVQVALRRRFFNNRIPIFQFGIFYDDNLEFHPGPRFDFGGRVHSNGSMFLMASTGLYFSSRVSAKGEILTDVARNGSPWTNWNENVFVRNGSGTYVQLKHDMGSALKNVVNGVNLFASNPDMPVVYKNANWNTNQALFQGNLLSNQKSLDLPLKLAGNLAGAPVEYIELIKRGKSVGDLYKNSAEVVGPVVAGSVDTDSQVTAKERYYSKPGIRVSLADSKAKLPGCASGVGVTAVVAQCGIRLDGDAAGKTEGLVAAGTARGYKPKPMSDGYQATELNGERFINDFGGTSREIWIKVELVANDVVNGNIVTTDVTEDILSLGITEPAPTITEGGTTRFAITGYGNTDSRSVIKLQRFVMPGARVTPSNTNYLNGYDWNSTSYNLVLASTTKSGENANTGFADNTAHRKTATVIDTSATRTVVPFPIEMFDTREGLFNDSIAPTSGTYYGTNTVPKNGVMSMIDIDVANLRAFLRGDFDTKMPNNTDYFTASTHVLRAADVPDSNGWVFYVSDRRGDYDFDGEYDMEDVYGGTSGGTYGNDGILQAGEDFNKNGTLQADFVNEAARYNDKVAPDIAAVIDHKFYRRGVRLINGTVIPGRYDAANPLNTRGFTVASENGVYVQGNYNATGVSVYGSPTPAINYNPQNTVDHIPASIAADAIVILSNNWLDSRSFRYPFSLSSRPSTETTIRFAMLAGDTSSSLDGTPNQGGGDTHLSGGVHNFKRFLEYWTTNLNYSGSLINLYNSHNNNGSFKCCTNVYDPPTRNWVFDASFLDPTRLPPGTPFFQTIQLTGFQRVNN